MSDGEKEFEKIFEKLLTKRQVCDKIHKTIKQNILRSHPTAQARRVYIQRLADGGKSLFVRGIFVPAFFVRLFLNRNRIFAAEGGQTMGVYLTLAQKK